MAYLREFVNRQGVRRVLMIVPPILFVLYIAHSLGVIRSLLSDSRSFHLDYANSLVQDYLENELNLEKQRLRLCLQDGSVPCEGTVWLSLEDRGTSKVAELPTAEGGTHPVFLNEAGIAASLETFMTSKPGLNSLFASLHHQPVYWVKIRDPGGGEVYRSGPDPSAREAMKTFSLERSLTGYHADVVYRSFGPQQLYSVARKKINFSLIFLLFLFFVFSLVLMTASIRQKLVLARQKTFFVTTVSHEFKTPLAILKLAAETLQAKRFRTKGEEEKFHTMIHREIHRLNHLVHKILSYNKIEMGQIHFHNKELDLQELVARSAEVFRVQAQADDLTLEVTYGPEPCYILGDETLIRQAIDNLLDNAFKYRGESKKVTVFCGQVNGAAELRIQDRGIGISGDEVRHIMKSFYRVDDPLSQGIRGSGLGLSISNHIFKNSRASITISSKLRQGSLFTVRFPLIDVPNDRS